MIGTVAVGLILPWAAWPSGFPCRRLGAPRCSAGATAGTRRSPSWPAPFGPGGRRAAGRARAPGLRGGRRRAGAVEALGDRADALERRHARVAAATTLVIQVCLAAAVTAVLAPASPRCTPTSSARSWSPCCRSPRWPPSRRFRACPWRWPGLVERAGVGRPPVRARGVPSPCTTRSPDPLGAAVPEVGFDDAALRYAPTSPRRRRGEPAPGGRRAGRGDRLERGRQVEPRRRAACATGRSRRARCRSAAPT